MPVYLKYEGVDGPITTTEYKGWIEIDAFALGMSRSREPGVNARGGTLGRGDRAASITDVGMAKRADETTTALMREALRGTRRKSAQVHFVKAGDVVEPYLEFDFDDVSLTNYSIDTQNAIPVERFEMTFRKFRSKYTPRDAKGNREAPIPVGYDATTGTTL